MNDKLLTLLMGKCWHEVEQGKINCKHCGKDGSFPWSLSIDFSDPRHMYEFFAWLTKERPEMWEGFRRYSHNVWRDDSKFSYSTVITDYDGYFYAWLFFSDPARPRDLMAEWLRLDSTVERFGWVEHHCSHCRKGDVQMHYTHPCEQCGAIGGRIRAEWAKG